MTMHVPAVLPPRPSRPLQGTSVQAYRPAVAAQSANGFGDPNRPKAQWRRNGAFLLRIAQPVLWRACRASFGSAGFPLVPGSPTRHARHPYRLATVGGGSSDQRSQP